MDERLKFVARRLAGESMTDLCREFGISRKTGYKIFDRYQECGVQGLTDRSRCPYRYANQLPFQVENYILNVKHEHPSWGARKIREHLVRRFSDIKLPAKSTIHAVLDRHGLVERRGRMRRHAQGTALSLGERPTNSGAPTTRASFCSAIASTVIRSPSLITPAAICCAAKLSPPPAKTTLLLCLSGCFRSADCRQHSQRQRRALRFRSCAVQLEQACGVVATPGHCHRT
ncbi:MAG TPA: helix-turn-helix domain-containing protein, partial [Terriglobales bacterium]